MKLYEPPEAYDRGSGAHERRTSGANVAERTEAPC